MGWINTVLGTPLGYLMRVCYTIIGDYGWAIVVFTLLTKVILFPISIWVQKNSIKMIRLQPQLNWIAVRYAGQKDTIAEEQLALYKKEGYRPLLSIIPMMIQIVLVLGLIGVIYNPLMHILHVDGDVINGFTNVARDILGVENLGSGAQLTLIELIQNPMHTHGFLAISVPGQNIPTIVGEIQGFSTQFLGMNLSHVPTWNNLVFIPVLAGMSAFLLSYCQNRVNVLQREQGWLGRWGMAIFLTAFSAYFGFLVPAGVGLYWICGNLFSILVLYLVNALYKPKKYIDYEALEKSKEALAEARAFEKENKPDPKQKKKAKEDYKRFLAEENEKRLVFYAEGSGYYKYFRGIVEHILTHSDVVIHYITSDANDRVFAMESAQFRPYYIDDNRLIPLFMKMEADMVVMTTPDLQNFHLKRSYVKKDIEYIYLCHGLTSTHMVVRKGAYDHYDTIFCVGQHQMDELRESERLYNQKEKKLVPVGYSLLDELLVRYVNMEQVPHEKPQILVAPSHQDGNLMEGLIAQLLPPLLDGKYRVILRPHPQYLRRNPGVMERLEREHPHWMENGLILEKDFSGDESIYQSDILVTDWSGIANEFSYTTKNPCLFINTPMKVLNPEYERYAMAPLDISLREVLGKSVDVAHMESVGEVVAELLANREAYRKQITDAMERYVFHIGHSGEIGGQYIIDGLMEREEAQ
ncbi:membrane protein insertase YidC [Eubacteriales bacterium OttesenSCG-928-M02]|nr:membrane protein insertase YidC [Eubacteriales bacterium OttesenSCG-928-M02]